MNITTIAGATAARLRRAATVGVLATAGLSLVAAGPASAEPKTPTPAKKGCEVQLKGPGAGQSIVYPDGYSFSVSAQNDGKTHTYTCNDGTWKETVSLTAAPHGVAAVAGSFQVLDSGAGRLDTRAVVAGTALARTP